jgi:hypothetical protein
MSSSRKPFREVLHVVFLVVISQLWGAASVCAEWRFVDGHNRAKVYVDTETISRHSELVSVWVMDDLLVAQARGLRKYLSTLAQEEHDCARERFRLQALEYFSGNMGSGEAFYKTAGESDWTPIPRGTLAQSVWNFVCVGKIR